jgi:translation initiation factor IF-1
MPEAAIETTGTVLERKGEILYRVELMNGKVVLGHLSKKLTDARAEFPEGAAVHLEMTPFDFDQARILGDA